MSQKGKSRKKENSSFVRKEIGIGGKDQPGIKTAHFTGKSQQKTEYIGREM